MSVVGIDFGAQSTKIGVARNKGIDIVSACPAKPSLTGELLPIPCLLISTSSRGVYYNGLILTDALPNL